MAELEVPDQKEAAKATGMKISSSLPDEWPILWESQKASYTPHRWNTEAIVQSMQEIFSDEVNSDGIAALQYFIEWKKGYSYGHIAFRTCPSRNDVWIVTPHTSKNFNTYHATTFDWSKAVRFDFEKGSEGYCTSIVVPRKHT